MSKYNEDQDGLVTCLICGAKRRSLSQHIKKHGLKAYEYRNLYPGAEMSCEETKKLHQENGTRVINLVYDNPESMKKLRESRSKNAKNQWANNKEFVDKMRLVGKEVMSRNLQNQDYVSRMQSPHLKDYQLSNGEIVKLRSGFEYRVYDFLIRYKFNFEYESLWIEYLREDGSKHHYTPDFYLPDFNLIIEVKPTCYIGNPRMVCKKKAALDLGYNLIFVTENEYWSDEKINSLIRNYVT